MAALRRHALAGPGRADHPAERPDEADERRERERDGEDDRDHAGSLGRVAVRVVTVNRPVTRSSPYLDEILRLDPVADHKRITHLVVCYEFPFDTTRALELAFFRTYAVPAIGELLDSTGEFARGAQRRYDDTDLS